MVRARAQKNVMSVLTHVCEYEVKIGTHVCTRVCEYVVDMGACVRKYDVGARACDMRGIVVRARVRV